MLVKQVTDLGRNWARLGLDKGRVALENGAHRLQATAQVLGGWSNKLSPSPAGEEQPAASAGVEASVAGGAAQASSAEATESVAE